MLIVLNTDLVYTLMYKFGVNTSSRAVWGVSLRPLACWDCGFESRRGNGCLSVVCHKMSAGRLCVGPITRPEESHRFYLTESDREASRMGKSWSTRGCCDIEKKKLGY